MRPGSVGAAFPVRQLAPYTLRASRKLRASLSLRRTLPQRKAAPTFRRIEPKPEPR
jgi:hypothetical protein